LNRYHQQVRQLIGDEMKRQGLADELVLWLHKNTQALDMT
jgi:hypothetical protein